MTTSKSGSKKVERPFTGTDKPWENPGQAAQDDTEKSKHKIDLEKWEKSETH